MDLIEVRPATADDAAAIAHVHYEALDAFHDFYGAFLANHPRVALPKATALALANPDQTFLAAVDATSGELVGFVRYHIVPEETAAEMDAKPAEETKTANQVPPLFAPKEHLKEVWERFCDREDEMEKCYTDAAKGQRHAYVKHLMVHPNHQRKGIGKKLLSTVVEKSDADGIPTFIVASAEAHGLYGKLGFEDLGTFRIDNGYWSQEIVKQEQKLGIHGNEELEQKFKGMEEVERYMVRWAR